MVRSYKRKTARAAVVNPETVRLALNDVREKKASVRKISEKYGINYRTLCRYRDKFDVPQQRIAPPEYTEETPSSHRNSGQKKAPRVFVSRNVAKTPESAGYAKPRMVNVICFQSSVPQRNIF